MAYIEPTNWLTTKIVTYTAKITPRCHDMTRLMSQAMDRRLPLSKRFSMRLHLLVCEWCLRYAKHLEFMRKASSSMPEQAGETLPDKLSDAAKDGIKRALEAHRH